MTIRKLLKASLSVSTISSSTVFCPFVWWARKDFWYITIEKKRV